MQELLRRWLEDHITDPLGMTHERVVEVPRLIEG